MAETVRIELEFGGVEFEFEGPAEFARRDLLPLIEGLVTRLAGLEDAVEIDFDDEDDDDDDDDNDNDNEPPVPPTRPS